MARSIRKALSLLLGILMFTFGFLKLFQPIHGWFTVQIEQSHLPHAAILMGELAEMTTGLLFLLPWLRKSLTGRLRGHVLLVACATLVVQMSVATYVHLQPEVPARVLPLGIKPPVIPLVVLLLAIVTAIAVWKEGRVRVAGDPKMSSPFPAVRRVPSPPAEPRNVRPGDEYQRS